MTSRLKRACTGRHILHLMPRGASRGLQRGAIVMMIVTGQTRSTPCWTKIARSSARNLNTDRSPPCPFLFVARIDRVVQKHDLPPRRRLRQRIVQPDELRISDRRLLADERRALAKFRVDVVEPLIVRRGACLFALELPRSLSSCAARQSRRGGLFGKSRRIESEELDQPVTLGERVEPLASCSRLDS